jgi:hypothetical protein
MVGALPAWRAPLTGSYGLPASESNTIDDVLEGYAAASAELIVRISASAAASMIGLTEVADQKPDALAL